MTHSFFCANVLGDRARWARTRHFTVLQAEFDAGRLFVETWAAWREDPQRCERLHFVAIGPLASMDLPDVLAEQPTLSQLLIDAWPMQVAGLHRLEFENGRVVLTLAIGEPESMLSKIWLRADAFYLRLSQADAKLAYIAKALARVAGDQATLCAEAHPLLPKALKDAGFICDETPDGAYVKARFAPRWRVRRHEPPLALAIEDATPTPSAAFSVGLATQPQTPRHAIVIGAGLAGCAITERLASRGMAGQPDRAS